MQHTFHSPDCIWMNVNLDKENFNANKSRPPARILPLTTVLFLFSVYLVKCDRGLLVNFACEWWDFIRSGLNQ